MKTFEELVFSAGFNMPSDSKLTPKQAINSLSSLCLHSMDGIESIVPSTPDAFMASIIKAPDEFSGRNITLFNLADGSVSFYPGSIMDDIATRVKDMLLDGAGEDFIKSRIVRML